MLKYAAALAITALPFALANSVNPIRDANLALINKSCLVMSGQSKASSFTAEGMVTILLTDVENKAVLYSVPVKNNCTADEVKKLPTLLLYFDASGSMLLFRLEVLLPVLYGPAVAPGPLGRPIYLFPAVWDGSWVTTHTGVVTPQDVEEQAASAFDAFALAWKKEHAK